MLPEVVSESSGVERSSERDRAVAVLQRCAEEGGPTPEQHGVMRAALGAIAAARREGRLADDELGLILGALGDAGSPDALLGMLLRSRCGIAPEVHLVDRLCGANISHDPVVGRWDAFVMALPFAAAARERTICFGQLVADAIVERRTAPGAIFHLLSIGGAPGRDIAELLACRPGLSIRAVVVEPDESAASYAADVLSPWRSRISIVRQSPLAFKASQRFDLIWSGGLFDGLSDKAVVATLTRSLSCLTPRGQLLVTSLQSALGAPDRMDLMGWRPTCRSAAALRFLAEQANIPRRRIATAPHPEGTLEFMRIEADAGGLEPASRATTAGA